MTLFRRIMGGVLLSVCLATPVAAQGVSRSGTVIPVGTSLPGTCTVGDLFFKSDATAGQNLYECAVTNTWTQQLNNGAGSGNGDALQGSPLSQFASTTSAQLAGVLSNETGTGVSVFNTTPTLVTPVLGAATATSINGLTITSSASGVLTVAAAKTLTFSNTLTFTGTDSSSVAFGTGGTVAYLGANTFTGRQNAGGAASTAPFKVGTSLPATCVIGDLYFKSNSTAGLNIHECASTDTWTQQLTGGGGGTGDALVASPLSQFASTTSAQLASVLSNETGTGVFALNTSPTFVTPTLGAALATSINGLALTTSTGTVTVANAKTLTFSNTLTFTGTDSSSVAFGAGGTVAYTGDTLASHASTTSAQLYGVLSDETGSASGALAVFSKSPTIETPTIASFANSAHNHSNAAGGANITGSAFASQSANCLFAGPDGTSGTMTCRAMVAGDLPQVIAEAAITGDTTIAVYGGAYEVNCGSPCTITLPTTTSHAGYTLAIRVVNGSSDVTLDGNGSQAIVDATSSATTKVFSQRHSANLIIDRGGAYWQKVSGE